jgi:hypothetical protein
VSRSDFLPELVPATRQGQLYLASRALWLGWPLLRWLTLLSALPFVGWLNGWALLIWLAAASACKVWATLCQRTHFTHFAPHADTPLPAPQPLAHKTALYASGLLQVGQKVQHFAFLPGFYRTFATREHALLCQVRPRSIWRIARWPEDEVGLWYAFWTASQLTAVTPGQIDNGQQRLPALAITYCPAAPPDSRQPAATTLYLAFLNEEARSNVLADLLVDWPPTMEPTR